MFFDWLKAPDINRGVQQFLNTPNAVLLDVREENEYAGGRIPGSVNLPLSRIGEAAKVVPDPSAPLFVYCLSGGRSSQAAAYLRRNRYEDVTNIGGISAYRGELER